MRELIFPLFPNRLDYQGMVDMLYTPYKTMSYMINAKSAILAIPLCGAEINHIQPTSPTSESLLTMVIYHKNG